MISHQYQFIFVHAGRTGGSSFERMTGIELTEDERTKHTGNTDFPEKHNDFQYYKSNYPGEFQSFFKFTIVRNPFDRLCSAWLWQTRVVKNIPPVTLKEFIATRPGSHTYAEKFKLEGLSIEQSILHFDFVGRFEDLINTYQYLCNKLNLPDIEIPHTNKTPSGRYQDYYDQDTIHLLKQKYGTDLELFGYNFSY
ncbi:MAG: sulfotransferase family 2 domain-containing protein [Bacteroidales bacterium]